MSAAEQILLVEDDPGDCILIERALKRASPDVRIRRHADGIDACEYLDTPIASRGAVRLCILDLKMPRRDGFEVLEWIGSRRRSGLEHFPTVVLTNSGEERDVRRAYSLGAASYLVKPVRPQEVETMISAVFTYWVRLNLIPPILPTP